MLSLLDVRDEQQTCISVEELCLVYPHTLAQFDALGFCPRPDLTPVHLESPIDWAMDPFNDRNWCFQLHAWRMNASVLRAYAEKATPELLERAISVALDWCSFHQRKATAFSWMDMATGLRAMQLAYFLDQINRGAYNPSHEEGITIKELAELHYERLSDIKFLSLNNHGVFQAYGLKLLAIALGRDAALANAFLMKTFDTQYTDQGLHKENSPGYHFFMTRRFRMFAEHGRLPPEAQRLVYQAENINDALVAPDGALVRFGDTEGRTSRPTEFPKDLHVTDLSSSGLVAVRRGRNALFVTGMGHTYTHKHADELSFELFHAGRPVFIDGGKYAYKKNKWRSYVVSSAAHNTISMNNGSIPVKSVSLSGSFLQKPSVKGNTATIPGRIRRIGFFEQTRHFTYTPGRSLKIVDEVAAEKNDAIVSSLLLAPGIEPKLFANGFEAVLSPRWRMVVQANAEVEAYYGSHRPLLGWHSPSYGKIKPNWTVRALKTGREVVIKWDVLWIKTA